MAISSGRSFAQSLTDVTKVPNLINPMDNQFLKNILDWTVGGTQGFISGGSSNQFELLNSGSLSFNDITGSLRAIAVLAINLFLMVIQVVAGILKALLPFLSK